MINSSSDDCTYAVTQPNSPKTLQTSPIETKDDIFELKEVLSSAVTDLPALVPIISFTIPSTTTSVVIQALQQLEKERRNSKKGAVRTGDRGAHGGVNNEKLSIITKNEQIAEDDDINKCIVDDTQRCEVDVFSDLRRWLFYLHRRESINKECGYSSNSGEKMTDPITYSSEGPKCTDEGYRMISEGDCPIIRMGCPNHLKRVRPIKRKVLPTSPLITKNSCNVEKKFSFVSKIVGPNDSTIPNSGAENAPLNCSYDCEEGVICNDEDFVLISSCFSVKQRNDAAVEVLVDWLPLMVLQREGASCSLSSHSSVKECIGNAAFIKKLVNGQESLQHLQEHSHITCSVENGINSESEMNNGHHLSSNKDICLSVNAWVEVFWNQIMNIVATSDHQRSRRTMRKASPTGQKEVCKNECPVSSSEISSLKSDISGDNNPNNKDSLQELQQCKPKERRPDAPCLLGWKLRLIPCASAARADHWAWLNDNVWPLATPRPPPSAVYIAPQRYLKAPLLTSMSQASLVKAPIRDSANDGNKKRILSNSSNTAFASAVRWIFENIIDGCNKGMEEHDVKGEGPQNDDGIHETGEEFITMTAVVCTLPPDDSDTGKTRTTPDIPYSPSILAVVRRKVSKKILLYLHSDITNANDAASHKQEEDLRNDSSYSTTTDSLVFPYGVEVCKEGDIINGIYNNRNSTSHCYSTPFESCPSFPVTWLPPLTTVGNTSLTSINGPHEHHVVFEALTLANMRTWEKHNQTVPDKTTTEDINETGKQQDDDDCLVTPDSALNSPSMPISPTRNNYYLCTDCDMVTNIEPCLMCSMGCIHSRVKRVVYRHRNIVHGGLSGAERTLDDDRQGTSSQYTPQQVQTYAGCQDGSKIERLFFDRCTSTRETSYMCGSGEGDICSDNVRKARLGGISQLHTIPSLNHHFRVFEVREEKS